jgi:hypothetical protein
MRSLSASELLEVWERGLGQPPVERALILLSACGTEPGESLPALSIGERDARLTALYERLFGEKLHSFAECPQCAERLEYSVSTRELAAAPAGAGGDLDLVCGELALRLRLPNSLDLRAVRECSDVATARRKLAERCVLEAVRNGDRVPADALQDPIVEQIALRLSEADPRAEALIDLTCSACRHRWQVVLDIERFLWSKIGVLAKRLLREVHILAQAYGWREADILSLSAVRRQFYLEMAVA